MISQEYSEQTLKEMALEVGLWAGTSESIGGKNLKFRNGNSKTRK